MKHFGIPYMGSKDKIVPSLLDRLPAGDRFVDLFGGGFAMSEGAILSGKYKRVFYNEYNGLLVALIKKAINGDYNYSRFTPAWITKQEFNEKKETDGYIKYCWSFGNSGQAYLYGDNIVEYKKMAHDYVINKVPFWGYKVVGETVKDRRLNLRRIIQDITGKALNHKGKRLFKNWRHLERLQHLEHLERLERLERLQHLGIELNCGSYEEYHYQDGDVVYCDPPYEGTARYAKSGFDHTGFYDWVYSRPFPVWFSSYDISDKRFKCVFAIKKTSLLHNNGTKVWEKLYYHDGKGG